ncbi:hypothetical protein BsWGS_27918 [Bradybaena similaris]
MTAQETANVAAIATLAGSPDSARGPHYGRDLVTPPCYSDHHLDFADIHKASLPVHDGAPKLKEINLKGSLTLAKEKLETANDKITGTPINDADDDLADIFISDEVLKQLRSHTDNKDKKSSKQRRKIAKTQSKVAKLTAANNKDEPDMVNRDPAKKILKPTLRRKMGLATSKSQIITRTGSMEFGGRNRRDAKNKAANNNWMMNEEAHICLTAANMFTRSPSSYVDNMPRVSGSVGRVCYTRNSTSRTCKCALETVGPASKEHSFKRADSSDDSGCFSNQSMQSINSPGFTKHEANNDPFQVNETSAIQDNETPAKKSSNTSGLCSACGNQPHGNGSGLCKTCIGRIKYDGIRIGALGELRAYAQSIADSVKKILSISPRGDGEVTQQLFTKESRESNKTDKPRHEQTTNVASLAGGLLHKCKTHIAMTVADDLRPKKVFKKSMSLDGRAVPFVDENSRGSPMYWITQEKSKPPPPVTLFCPLEEEKLLRCQENTSDHSVLEGDYFSSSAKELKQYTAQDDDKNAKTDKADRPNKRNYTKQVSCVADKMRSEGSSRGNSFQQEKKHESKKVYELHRSRSRISRTANADVDVYEKPLHKREEEIKALNVFRLKVIHEGSPVDPLYTVQKAKGGEDSKDRRALLMRSATAPNKNHMPKKDNTAEDKLAMMKNVIKAKRSSTQLGIKTCSSPIFANEDSNIENEEETKQILYEPLPESWRDDTSVMAVPSFIKRRSTSYDCVKTILSKRSDALKNIPRSAIERDATRTRQRKKTPSKNHTVELNNSRSENGYSSKIWQTSRFPVCWADENHAEVSLPVAVSVNRDPATENHRHHKVDFLDKEFLPADRNDRVSTMNDTERPESPNTPAYFGDAPYYQHLTQPTLSPKLKELAYVGKQNIFGTDSYYRDTEESSIDDGFDAGIDVDYDDTANVDRRFKGHQGEDTYHSPVKEYSPKHVSPEKESLWYSSHLDRRALMARDGSRESKSSTSFHIVMNVRSSHSDVALMKYQGTWEHPTSRRQSMYSETDVDTGLIYHFAKRQTTRAHVPAYHDLTSASKDIYTMSGDVSTSASSNSSISNKTEVSECEYTGGFYKRDPFYDNDSKLSSSNSSADTSGQLYFEPSIDTKREASELDIYTGAVFSSSQNALSLGRSTHTPPASQPAEALKNGSTNNSARPSRMSRRLRHRAHIDVIKFKSTDSVNELISKCMEPNSELILCNISNNSCTWCHIGEPEDSGSHQGAVVTLNSEPMYTDYDVGMKPVFHTQKIEKNELVIDLLKYERQDNSSSGLFFTTPTDDNKSDSDWYNGFSRHKKIEPVPRYTAAKTQSCIQCAYSWQHHDDYYTSPQRPKLDKSNNNKLDPWEAAGDTNNNRLDDIYTGFMESPKTQRSPEQQPRSRKTSSDSWYADQSRRSHSGFYRDNETPPESAARSFASDYESAEGGYSSPSVFAQAREAYAGPSSYMPRADWKPYNKNRSSPTSSYVDEDDDDESPRPRPLTPGGYSSGDTYSYFPYGSNLNPADGGYLYDSENYGLDRRSPSPEQGDDNEIKKVGGIVCRENVANKEDYAEDVNRDLEQAVWTPYSFRHNEEKVRHADEPSSSRSEPPSEAHKAPLAASIDKHARHFDDSIYNQNRLYDSGGDRKKWRREATMNKKSVTAIKKEKSPHRASSAGDNKKQDYVKSTAWNPPDQIPDKARGKRNQSSTPKPPISEGSKLSGATSHVISSVTSLPSRFTNYVKKWL